MMLHEQISRHLANYMEQMAKFEDKEFHIFELWSWLGKVCDRIIVYLPDMFD